MDGGKRLLDGRLRSGTGSSKGGPIFTKGATKYYPILMGALKFYDTGTAPRVADSVNLSIGLVTAIPLLMLR